MCLFCLKINLENIQNLQDNVRIMAEFQIYKLCIHHKNPKDAIQVVLSC